MYSQYIEEKKVLQENLLKYITDEDNIEENYQNLFQNFQDQNYQQNPSELKIIMKMLLKISNFHIRSSIFFAKIEKIILLFKDDLLKNFSNMDIFSIFETNNRILLFLLEKNIVKLEQEIYDRITKNKSIYYFYPEIISYNESKKEIIRSTYDKKIIENIENDLDLFKTKRKIGENDTYVCQLIRNDDIDNFISYFHQKEISYNSNIEESFYETNPLLFSQEKIVNEGQKQKVIINNPTLIEYASYFGSIQIFNFLYKNDPKLIQNSLLKYAIHGSHPEIIQILEDKKIIKENLTHCFDFAIQFFNEEMVNYLKRRIQSNSQYSEIPIDYFNFFYFPPNINNSNFISLCQKGFLKLVEIVLNNSKMTYDLNLIFTIISQDDLDMLKLLLNNNPQDVNNQIKSNKFEKIGCLCYAVLNNKNKIVQSLLTIKNIDVNLKCVEKESVYTCITATALHLAVKNNNYEIVSLLLNHPKIGINEIMTEKYCFDESGEGEYNEKITNTGSILFEKNALIIAIEREYEDIVEILLNNKEIDVNCILETKYEYKYIWQDNPYYGSDDYYSCSDKNVDQINAILCALTVDNEHIISLLLRRHDIEVNTSCSRIENFEDVESFMKELVNANYYGDVAGFDIEGKSVSISPIKYAIENNDYYILKYFIKKLKIDMHGNTMLKQAIEMNDTETINYLLSKPNCNFEKGLENSLIMAIENNNMEVFNILINRPEININDNTGFKTALIAAIQNNNIEAFGVLLSRPEININQNSNGKTALKTAVERENIEIIKILLEQPKIDVNDKSGNKTALKIAVEKDNIEIVKILLDQPEIDVNDNSGNKTALKIAVERENIEIIKILLDQPKIDVNDNTGNKTALIIAVEKDKIEIVKILLGCPTIDINDGSGNKSPIKIAANKCNYEMVKLLATRQEINFDLETIYNDISHDKLKIILLLGSLKKDKKKD